MNKPPETFTTARLLLRPPVQDDAEEIFSGWAQDPEVTRFLVWSPHETISETSAHISRSRAAWEDGSAYTWLLESGEEDLVGSLAARPGKHGINLGYLLARSAWGNGFMSEAVEEVSAWFLNQPTVFRIWATCDCENLSSAQVLDRTAFQREGVLRRWEQHPNISAEPRDSICYSLVR